MSEGDQIKEDVLALFKSLSGQGQRQLVEELRSQLRPDPERIALSSERQQERISPPPS